MTLNDSKAFIEYSNDMDGIYKNFEESNLNEKYKILIVFDDMIVYMLSNKNLNPTVTELFTKVDNLTIFLFLSLSLYQKYQTKFYTLFHYENCK